MGLKRQEIHIEDTTLVEGGGSISPRYWVGNIWIIFGGMVGLILQWADTISGREQGRKKRGCIGCDRTHPFVRNAPPICQTTPSPHTEGYYSINAMIVIYKYTLF